MFLVHNTKCEDGSISLYFQQCLWSKIILSQVEERVGELLLNFCSRVLLDFSVRCKDT